MDSFFYRPHKGVLLLTHAGEIVCKHTNKAVNRAMITGGDVRPGAYTKLGRAISTLYQVTIRFVRDEPITWYFTSEEEAISELNMLLYGVPKKEFHTETHEISEDSAFLLKG